MRWTADRENGGGLNVLGFLFVKDKLEKLNKTTPSFLAASAPLLFSKMYDSVRIPI